THAWSQTVRSSSHSSEQAPFEQRRSSSQALPQAPQCWALESRLTQSPLQAVSPALQLAPAPHTPPEQDSPSAHAFPQAPQCLASFWRSMHVMPHIDVPPSQPVGSGAMHSSADGANWLKQKSKSRSLTLCPATMTEITLIGSPV